MLARVARRKVRRDAFQHLTPSFEQLRLPWLCPAFLASRRSTATAATTGSSAEPRRHKTSRPAVQRTATRSLATAADFVHSQQDSIPFEGVHLLNQSQPWSTSRATPSLSELRSWTSSDIVVFQSAATVPPPTIATKLGIGGDPTELYQNLHASLRVGRIERAAALVRRLAEIYTPHATELLEAHNFFLEGMAEAAEHQRPGATLQAMQKWFEVEMRAKEVIPDARTYVTMIRATVAHMEGSKQARTLRRYMHLAEESDKQIYADTMNSEEYTKKEFAAICNAQPDRFYAPPPEVTENLTDEAQSEDEALRLQRVGASTSAIPEIRPVHQKGLGLQTLKKALSIFDPSHELNSPNAHSKEDGISLAHARQSRMEEDVVDAAIERWRAENENLKKLGISSALKTKPLEALMWQWYTELLPLLKEEMKTIRQALDNPKEHPQSDQLRYGPFLEPFTAEKLAAQSIIVLVSSHGSADGVLGCRLGPLAMKLASELETESTIELHKRQAKASGRKHLSQERLQALAKMSKGPLRLRPSIAAPKPDEATQVQNMQRLEWPAVVKVKVGAMLISKVIEVCKIPVTRTDSKTGKTVTVQEPAFSHTVLFEKGRRIKTEPPRGALGARLPMVVEPKPWTGFREGGFLRYPTPVVRQRGQDDIQKVYAVAAAEKGDLDQVFAGLNVLGRTPWRINSKVFDVMAEAWNTGEAIGELAPENPDIPYPPEPKEGADPMERKWWLKRIKEIDNLKSGYHSQRCYQNFQLEIARALRDEVFYFPHNLDFRGRAYPLPPLFNHMGADPARGLLIFGTGKELGSVGLSWLKVHLANLAGYDKASLKEREEFATKHMDDIRDSATNPLGGRRWWLKTEDPWQCLATCFELKAAFDSPDPTRYVSHLAVHQDGTCNGLQHYAALGGDKAGASQVNLEPSDRPQDVYTAVAELVKAEIKQEAAEGNPAAKFLDGHISRKVVKQTVMTNVYGVTFTGARAQVQARLKDIFPKFEEQPGFAGLPGLAAYIARKIFAALASMFGGAHDIQYWLGECATRILTSLSAEQIALIVAEADGKVGSADAKFRKARNKQKGQANDYITQFKNGVIWTTPLKMPIVQPYRKTKVSQIRTMIQGISIRQPRLTDAVEKRKQLQAFPPNFIHSLDATHMLLSALKCNEIGLTFASVHDSFWTHAADVPAMNRVLRDAFVRMHSEDIIGRLAAEFQARHAGSWYMTSLVRATPVGQKIAAWRLQQGKSSTKKSTKTTWAGAANASINELVLEVKRQKLLDSEDPEERRQGREMVTPCSIFEAEADESAIAEPAGLGEALLGQVQAHNAEDVDSALAGDLEQVEAAEGEIDSPAEETNTAADDESSIDSMEVAEGAETKTSDEQSATPGKPAKKKYRTVYKVQLWRPMSFPPVPKKGDFDVSRLRDSQYFFS
ncbi:DNA-directed RNA polymerase [Coniosporium tulheliwenetii]|uniref:DNA-directed RNA polymerase n=1 Tax=Coniosporium tulheliwenetii TaxID=3383036 RepID=A0ACC2ZA95_9PEZI|nr:DNA-directed RNA polymerase [Cladosporium sp. JES 115]